jgi:3-oxoacyl-[acyl-carrier-protein] synthase III
MAPLRGKSACIGLATEGVGEAPGFSAMELMAKASLGAINDAGLSPTDIDAVFAATAIHAMPALSLSEHLGIRPIFSDGNNMGGSSFMAHALTAAMAIDAGMIDTALIAYGSNQRSAAALNPSQNPCLLRRTISRGCL